MIRVMDPSTPRLAASNHPEAYAAADRPGTRPAVEPARPVDIDRRPAHAPESEPQSELGFADFLDMINPLQHIPVVGDLYRYLTGDQIAGSARVVGGALFGGPIGFVAGIVNALVAEASGGNPGELVLTALFGDDDPELVAAAGTGTPVADAPSVVSAPQEPPLPALAAYRVPAAPALPGGQPPLTGAAAALQALGTDLRGASGSVASALPAGPALAPTSSSAGIDVRYLTPPPRNAFTSQMLEGLDKYKAMSVSPNHSLDKSL